jgi:D-sedoheptulose 7-phosphate isomerase
MADTLDDQLSDHLAIVDALRDVIPTVAGLARTICLRFDQGGMVLTFGNGGSAADAQHLAAELVGRYLRDRRPLPAVALTTDPSVVSCIANDFGYEEVFARQVTALARPADVVIGFSTSGMSRAVISGLRAGRANGALAALFTGADGRPAAEHADVILRVPSLITARIQEGHLLLLHLLSDEIDRWASTTEPNAGSG